MQREIIGQIDVRRDRIAVLEQWVGQPQRVPAYLRAAFPQHLRRLDEGRIGTQRVVEQVAVRQRERDFPRAVILAAGKTRLGGAVGVEKVQIEVEVARDGVQRLRTVPVRGDEQPRAVVHRIVDADAALDKQAIRIHVDGFGEVGLHRRRYVQVGEERVRLHQRRRDHPPMVGRVKTAGQHPHDGAPHELLQLRQQRNPRRAAHLARAGQLNRGAQLLHRKAGIRRGIVVDGEQIDVAAGPLRAKHKIDSLSRTRQVGFVARPQRQTRARDDEMPGVDRIGHPIIRMHQAAVARMIGIGDLPVLHGINVIGQNL